LSVAQYHLHHKSFCPEWEVKKCPSIDLYQHLFCTTLDFTTFHVLNCHVLQALCESCSTHARCPCHTLPLSLQIADVSQVRAVCSPTDSLIVSASRDATAISWRRPSPSEPFGVQAVLRPGSGRFVSTVTYIPPSPDAPEGE